MAAERRRRRREGRRKDRAGELREIKDYFGLPRPHRQRHQLPRPQPPEVISSGESEDLEQLPLQPQNVVLVDLGGTYEELPDLGVAALRQAYMLLERVEAGQQLPQFPELPLTPPRELEPETNWYNLEEWLADLDQFRQHLQPPPPALDPRPVPLPQQAINWELIA